MSPTNGLSKAQPPAQVKKTRRPGRGALFLIAMLLGISGLMRLGSGANHALANSQNEIPDVPEASEICETPAGTMVILEELRAREKRLSDREAMIADRAQALSLAEAAIDAKLASLVAAEDKLAATLAQADQAADEDVARLVAVYERMKPKEAAPLFEEMAPEFAAGFLARMRPEAAASIMAGLEPKRAYSISVLLAGRNANAPRN